MSHSPLMFLLLAGVWSQADAALVVLDEHRVLDSERGIIWLDTNLTAGLLPDNQYTQGGWYFPHDPSGPVPLLGTDISLFDALNGYSPTAHWSAPILLPFNRVVANALLALGATFTGGQYRLVFHSCGLSPYPTEGYGCSKGFFYYTEQENQWALTVDYVPTGFQDAQTPEEFWADKRPVLYQIDPDADADAVLNTIDNCSLVPNPSQCDSDADGYGNHCDGDLSNNGFTNAQDTVIFRNTLGAGTPGPTYNLGDLNCNGVVNAQDTVLFRQLLGNPPGPSGLAP